MTTPYPRAHYFIALVLLATVIGFWPSYFGDIGDAPLAFHVHGIIATAWAALVIFHCGLIAGPILSANVHQRSYGVW